MSKLLIAVVVITLLVIGAGCIGAPEEVDQQNTSQTADKEPTDNNESNGHENISTSTKGTNRSVNPDPHVVVPPNQKSDSPPVAVALEFSNHRYNGTNKSTQRDYLHHNSTTEVSNERNTNINILNAEELSVEEYESRTGITLSDKWSREDHALVAVYRVDTRKNKTLNRTADYHQLVKVDGRWKIIS
jgi:hypothetical protein